MTVHIMLDRCKPKTTEPRRKRRTVRDPFLGRIPVSRGEDGRYACPHGCGQSFTRADYIIRHAQSYCPVTNQTPQLRDASTPMNLGPRSVQPFGVETGPVKVHSVANIIEPLSNLSIESLCPDIKNPKLRYPDI